MAPSNVLASQPTLRTLRHDAKTSSPAKPSTARQPAAASLRTADERLAAAAQKPLVSGPLFRWKSPAERMKAMKVDLGRVAATRAMLEREEEAEGDDQHSLFGHALANTQLINLSLPFIAFSRSIEPKTRSLPLVVHHRHAIVQAICYAMRASKREVELCGEHILE